jgi:hypothetical protein
MYTRRSLCIAVGNYEGFYRLLEVAKAYRILQCKNVNDIVQKSGQHYTVHRLMTNVQNARTK